MSRQNMSVLYQGRYALIDKKQFDSLPICKLGGVCSCQVMHHRAYCNYLGECDWKSKPRK